MKKSLVKILIIVLVIIFLIKISIYMVKVSESKIEVENYISDSSSYRYYDKGLINIPSIGLKSVIKKANYNFSNLDNNIVYYKNINPLNRIILFSHSGYGYGTFFSRINELKDKDLLYINYKDKSYKYTYYKSLLVDSNNTTFLYDVKNKKDIYLVTCKKNDKSKRLVVIFKLKSVKNVEK